MTHTCKRQKPLTQYSACDIIMCTTISHDWKIFAIFFTIMLNPLPNDKILELTKLKAFADDKLDIAKMRTSLFNRVENTVGKGENAGYQHFLLFSKCFHSLFLQSR